MCEIKTFFSVELSGLDLPDVTMGIAPSVTRKLSRKRPRQSLNVTAFEKRLKGGDGEFQHVVVSQQNFGSCYIVYILW